ncbi:hypothetical protein N9Z18_01845 [Verrucomicrobiales bacterium]|jgi:hypothetical protein|nr:hypothetical protein [Verrucomicrobiales bacterium]MDA7926509.1 hypothetical protein [Verrucomicrobiales bacterium]MDB4358965.1 hypothetical protein [Verrucomicrobiales bacterium]|tara:strand:+ start:503 stop:919 length:417 start_codon:yes stop_codon:yes gene_type:complete
MSDSSPISESKVKRFFGTLGIFVFFGFLALILFQYAGSDSLEDRAARGDFDEATTQARWDNLKSVTEAQAVDQDKIAAAMKTVAKVAAKPAKTDIVVPGSPTFLKQMEAAAKPEAKPAAEAKSAPAKPAAKAEPEAKK